MYLEELRDPITNTVLANVPFILSNLVTKYGEIDPDTVAKKELNVRKMAFTVADPLTKLWKEIEDIEQISIVSNSPYSQF